MAKNERGIAQLPKERRFTRRHLLLSGAVGGIAIYQAARHPDALRDIYNSANELFVPEAPGRIIAQEIGRLESSVFTCLAN